MAEKLVSIAPNIWLFPCDDDAQAGRLQPAVGVICTATHTILVDAGNSPAHARRIRAALGRIAAPPVRFVIYTHQRRPPHHHVDRHRARIGLLTHLSSPWMSLHVSNGWRSG